MCRIAGILAPCFTDNTKIVSRMVDCLAHGGPDGSGVHNFGRLTLGHRRLSIIDRGASADQPFILGTSVLSYNGELYNCRELRQELEGAGLVFVTRSDTEVVLRALMHWGAVALSRFNGMFALAYWDGEKGELHLARDHVGMKPLYYGYCDEGLVFASELKALRVCPGISGKIDTTAVGHFLRRGYIGAPSTIFKEVRKVRPGTALVFTSTTDSPTSYSFYQQPAYDLRVDDGTLIDQFQNRFQASCDRHLLADVPVGVLLSGGIDSALIACTTSRFRSAPIQTYTLGFEDENFNEAPAAEAVARYLGTSHQTFYVGTDDFRRKIPQLTKIYDEPFADSSAIATSLLAERVAREVKCVLAGDGGDELFGGYAKYRATQKFTAFARYLPLSFRRVLAGMAEVIRPDQLKTVLATLRLEGKHTEDRFYKLGQSLKATTPADFFRRASDYGGDDVLMRLGYSYNIIHKSSEMSTSFGEELEENFFKRMHNGTGLGLILPMPIDENWTKSNMLYRMAIADMENFLEGDLMVKTDRAAMRYGLEVRFPFLDKKMIEFGLSLPDHQKIIGSKNKVLLRQSLSKFLPRNLMSSDKQGFAIPLKKILQKKTLSDELRMIGADRVFADRFGFFSAGLAGIINDFLSGSSYVNVHPVWHLFILHQWHRSWPK